MVDLAFNPVYLRARCGCVRSSGWGECEYDINVRTLDDVGSAFWAIDVRPRFLQWMTDHRFQDFRVLKCHVLDY